MIETSVLEHLEETLSVPVRMEIPANRPEKFIVVTKTGGGESDKIRSAMIVLDCFDSSMLGAAQLCEDAIEAMGAFEGCSGCHLNSSYNDTDTASRRYCYGALFDIYY